jgi:hypothetical protein
VKKVPPPDTPPSAFQKDVENWYEHFAIHPVMAGHIEELAGLVRKNGGKLILMQLPNRAAYQDEVEILHGEDYARECTALKALSAKLQVPLYLYREPSECGLTDADYEDYGHMLPAGADIFTRRLAGLLRNEGL